MHLSCVCLSFGRFLVLEGACFAWLRKDVLVLWASLQPVFEAASSEEKPFPAVRMDGRQREGLSARVGRAEASSLLFPRLPLTLSKSGCQLAATAEHFLSADS